MRELFDLIEDINDRLRRSFSILQGSGGMKWEKSEQKALVSKVIHFSLNNFLFFILNM